MEEKKLTLKTAGGSWRMLAVFVVLMLLFSLFANLVTSKGFKIDVSDITYEVRGRELSMELYKPMEVSSNDSLPCMIIAHGGSESLSATSMLSWEFAKRGFVVLSVSMYSSGLSEQPAINDDGTREENYFRGGTQGMYDALQYARSISYVDKTRIGMWGHSAGYYCISGAVLLDGSSYTLNDRMLNVLYNQFGVKITEDQLAQDADDIATAQLHENRLELYKYLKTGQKAIYDGYVKAARMGEFFFGQTVNVAGFEVKRDPQVNMMIGLGTHEGTGSYYLGTTENYKNIFHTGTKDVVRNGWYNICDYISDPFATSTLIGEIFDISAATSKALQSAIDDRTARLFLSPETFHNGMLWDGRAISETLEFFAQALGWNNGNIGDNSTKPISTTSLASSYIALTFTTLSFFALIGVVIAMASILLKSKFFAPCATVPYKAKLSIRSPEFYIAAVLSAIAAFMGTYFSSEEDISFSWANATATKFLPWEPGQMRTFMMILGTAVTGVVLFLIFKAVFHKKKNGNIPGISALNIRFGWVPVLKTVLMCGILFAVCYISAAIINSAFDSRFLSIDGSFELMKPYGFARMVKYAFILLPFTLIMSSLNSLTLVKDLKDGADTVVNVVVTSFGAELLIAIGFILTYSTPQHAVVFHLHAILSLIILVPVMNYLYRKFFKMTGSVWAGAIIVALIIGWRLSSYISHQFIYWGPNLVRAFWGIY
jgi:hypothetical protein